MFAIYFVQLFWSLVRQRSRAWMLYLSILFFWSIRAELGAVVAKEQCGFGFLRGTTSIECGSCVLVQM